MAQKSGEATTLEEAAQSGMVVAVRAAEAPDRPAITSPAGDPGVVAVAEGGGHRHGSVL